MARERSPNYPAHGLGESIEMARRIYAAEKRASIPYESAARALGYTSLSGRARVKISTLRKFGLIDEAQGRVRISDLAMRILFASSPQAEYFAKGEAAMRPDLFRDLRENGEASDATLVNDLVRNGFSIDGARAAVASFRETMRVLSSSPDVQEVASEQEDDMLDTTPPFRSEPAGPGFARQHTSRPEQGGDGYSWPLPNGVRVDLRFAGGPFTRDGLRVLRKYLDVIEEVIPASSEPEPPGEQSPPDAPD